MKNRDYKNFRAPRHDYLFWGMAFILAIFMAAAIVLVMTAVYAFNEPDSQPGHDTETVSVCELIIHQDDLP